VENLGLGISLWDEPRPPWPEIALGAAVLKFAGIAIGVIYSASGPLARLGGGRPSGRA
jgi:hypothetical protein